MARVRQTGQCAQANGAGIGATINCDKIERSDFRIAPFAGQPFDTPFRLAAQMLEHGHATGAKASLAQQTGDHGG
ncbi:hypothetical protein A245_43440, partial [Pseudomonas syringae pv. actinidiae ICMP 19096]